MNIPKDMIPGTLHKTNNSGIIEIIEYHSWDSVKVKFIDTNATVFTRSEKIRRGSVRDKNRRTVCGVGFVGYGKYSGGTGVPGKHSESYKCWIRMITRCYGELSLKEKPTYKDCTVCDEWHNFQNFAEWHEANYPKDGNTYDLDKDVKSRDSKIYSPDTCTFISHAQNAQIAKAKFHKLISPLGEVVEIYNMTAFCKDKDLSISCMCEVSRGVREKYKGWTKAD